ncbi:hypothetical protein IWQ60_011523 [Tieghemiomyces parasiticus]|uniref:Uncharacterized protein n=1 Tax=Tieghemiomyces parasiticus TaxID=78921 RepID=A0A9W8DH75_9FUNG|nr:hypothetical protein IWQ60_011523 [Tieghemiomyces parasiticus]
MAGPHSNAIPEDITEKLRSTHPILQQQAARQLLTRLGNRTTETALEPLWQLLAQTDTPSAAFVDIRASFVVLFDKNTSRATEADRRAALRRAALTSVALPLPRAVRMLGTTMFMLSALKHVSCSVPVFTADPSSAEHPLRTVARLRPTLVGTLLRDDGLYLRHLPSEVTAQLLAFYEPFLAYVVLASEPELGTAREYTFQLLDEVIRIDLAPDWMLVDWALGFYDRSLQALPRLDPTDPTGSVQVGWIVLRHAHRFLLRLTAQVSARGASDAPDHTANRVGALLCRTYGVALATLYAYSVAEQPMGWIPRALLELHESAAVCLLDATAAAPPAYLVQLVRTTLLQLMMLNPRTERVGQIVRLWSHLSKVEPPHGPGTATTAQQTLARMVDLRVTFASAAWGDLRATADDLDVVLALFAQNPTAAAETCQPALRTIEDPLFPTALLLTPHPALALAAIQYLAGRSCPPLERLAALPIVLHAVNRAADSTDPIYQRGVAWILYHVLPALAADRDPYATSRLHVVVTDWLAVEQWNSNGFPTTAPAALRLLYRCVLAQSRLQPILRHALQTWAVCRKQANPKLPPSFTETALEEAALGTLRDLTLSNGLQHGMWALEVLTPLLRYTRLTPKGLGLALAAVNRCVELKQVAPAVAWRALIRSCATDPADIAVRRQLLRFWGLVGRYRGTTEPDVLFRSEALTAQLLPMGLTGECDPALAPDLWTAVASFPPAEVIQQLEDTPRVLSERLRDCISAPGVGTLWAHLFKHEIHHMLRSVFKGGRGPLRARPAAPTATTAARDRALVTVQGALAGPGMVTPGVLYALADTADLANIIPSNTDSGAALADFAVQLNSRLDVDHWLARLHTVQAWSAHFDAALERLVSESSGPSDGDPTATLTAYVGRLQTAWLPHLTRRHRVDDLARTLLALGGLLTSVPRVAPALARQLAQAVRETLDTAFPWSTELPSQNDTVLFALTALVSRLAHVLRGDEPLGEKVLHFMTVGLAETARPWFQWGSAFHLGFLGRGLTADATVSHRLHAQARAHLEALAATLQSPPPTATFALQIGGALGLTYAHVSMPHPSPVAAAEIQACIDAAQARVAQLANSEGPPAGLDTPDIAALVYLAALPHSTEHAIDPKVLAYLASAPAVSRSLPILGQDLLPVVAAQFRVRYGLSTDDLSLATANLVDRLPAVPSKARVRLIGGVAGLLGVNWLAPWLPPLPALLLLEPATFSDALQTLTGLAATVTSSEDSAMEGLGDAKLRGAAQFLVGAVGCALAQLPSTVTSLGPGRATGTASGPNPGASGAYFEALRRVGASGQAPATYDRLPANLSYLRAAVATASAVLDTHANDARLADDTSPEDNRDLRCVRELLAALLRLPRQLPAMDWGGFLARVLLLRPPSDVRLLVLRLAAKYAPHLPSVQELLVVLLTRAPPAALFPDLHPDHFALGVHSLRALLRLAHLPTAAPLLSEAMWPILARVTPSGYDDEGVRGETSLRAPPTVALAAPKLLELVELLAQRVASASSPTEDAGLALRTGFYLAMAPALAGTARTNPTVKPDRRMEMAAAVETAPSEADHSAAQLRIDLRTLLINLARTNTLADVPLGTPTEVLWFVFIEACLPDWSAVGQFLDLDLSADRENATSGGHTVMPADFGPWLPVLQSRGQIDRFVFIVATMVRLGRCPRLETLSALCRVALLAAAAPSSDQGQPGLLPAEPEWWSRICRYIVEAIVASSMVPSSRLPTTPEDTGLVLDRARSDALFAEWQVRLLDLTLITTTRLTREADARDPGLAAAKAACTVRRALDGLYAPLCYILATAQTRVLDLVATTYDTLATELPRFPSATLPPWAPELNFRGHANILAYLRPVSSVSLLVRRATGNIDQTDDAQPLNLSYLVATLPALLVTSPNRTLAGRQITKRLVRFAKMHRQAAATMVAADVGGHQFDTLLSRTLGNLLPYLEPEEMWLALET